MGGERTFMKWIHLKFKILNLLPLSSSGANINQLIKFFILLNLILSHESIKNI